MAGYPEQTSSMADHHTFPKQELRNRIIAKMNQVDKLWAQAAKEPDKAKAAQLRAEGKAKGESAGVAVMSYQNEFALLLPAASEQIEDEIFSFQHIVKDLAAQDPRVVETIQESAKIFGVGNMGFLVCSNTEECKEKVEVLRRALAMRERVEKEESRLIDFGETMDLLKAAGALGDAKSG